MLAWEAPSVNADQVTTVQIITLTNSLLLIYNLINYFIN
jgi:hypothetical protein